MSICSIFFFWRCFGGFENFRNSEEETHRGRCNRAAWKIDEEAIRHQDEMRVFLFPHRNVCSSQHYVSREYAAFAQARLRPGSGLLTLLIHLIGNRQLLTRGPKRPPSPGQRYEFCHYYNRVPVSKHTPH
jgi:hypothetical protein